MSGTLVGTLGVVGALGSSPPNAKYSLEPNGISWVPKNMKAAAKKTMQQHCGNTIVRHGKRQRQMAGETVQGRWKCAKGWGNCAEGCKNYAKCWEELCEGRGNEGYPLVFAMLFALSDDQLTPPRLPTRAPLTVELIKTLETIILVSRRGSFGCDVSYATLQISQG